MVDRTTLTRWHMLLAAFIFPAILMFSSSRKFIYLIVDKEK